MQAIYTVFSSFGSSIGAIVGGYIVADLSLDWLHWINVLLSAITFLLCLFLLPETLYQREQTTVTFDDDPDKPTHEMKEQVTVTDTTTSYPPYSYLKSLRLYTFYPGTSVLEKFLAPFKVTRLPGVWLVSGWYTGIIGLVVTMSSVASQLVAAPPYRWGKHVGLINVGGIIGTILGCVSCSLLSPSSPYPFFSFFLTDNKPKAYTYAITDFATKRLARKDLHGFAESESRLVTAIPALFISTSGAIIFGIVAQNPSELGWVGLQFGFGSVMFGLMQVPSVGFNYLIDSYGSLAGDCFVMVTTSRAIITFSWTFFMGEWVTKRGPAEPFGIFGMLMGLFSVFVIPFLFWGKRLRIWSAKWLPEQ